MSESERLRALIDTFINCEDYKENDICDYLLTHGVIVPPCEKVYYIVDKNTKYATIHRRSIQELCICEIKNLSHYGYYLTREEAEKALKGGVINE